MTKKVVITRKRVIEEKAETTVSASDPADAEAAVHHLVDGQQLPWRYNRTLETSEPKIEVREVKSKQES